MHDVSAAADAVARGEAVVYPTETVYGLGADALDAAAVDHVYELKGRSRENPFSLGVPGVDAALSYTDPTDREEAFMRRFLPGPVTVVVERDPVVPDALTAGRDRVGVRVPDHDLAQRLLGAAGPLTATSANRSGAGSVTDPVALGEGVRESVAVVLDDGETPGTESTVVDPGEGVVHRRGAGADAVEAWLAEH
ncbi:MAG: L-threonylcarbamoyladenylate synthase [Halolamina sp.]